MRMATRVMTPTQGSSWLSFSQRTLEPGRRMRRLGMSKQALLTLGGHRRRVPYIGVLLVGQPPCYDVLEDILQAADRKT